MAHSYLIFNFGANEEFAQQARHRIEGWRQVFRLGKKMELKFERKAPEQPSGKSGADGKEQIRLLIRLDFSEHERLSHQRWLDRIPTEEPFKSAPSQVVRHGESDFMKTAELFDSLS